MSETVPTINRVAAVVEPTEPYLAGPEPWTVTIRRPPTESAPPLAQIRVQQGSATTLMAKVDGSA